MTTVRDAESGTLSYYSRYLFNYLQEKDSPLKGDTAFVATRVEQASREFERCRKAGCSLYRSQRAAMSVLTDGL